jgi:hypothetical protein
MSVQAASNSLKSSVTPVTRLRTGKFGVLFPIRTDLPLLHNIHIGTEGHLASYLTGRPIRVPPPATKRTGHEDDHSPPALRRD